VPRPAALALAALLALAAACDAEKTQTCPGEPVAALTFGGTRVSAGDPALAGLDPVPALADCVPAAVGDPCLAPETPTCETLPAFAATLSDAGAEAAALCRTTGIVLLGRWTGARVVVEAGNEGAVLGACSTTCTASLRLVVAGDVAGVPPDPLTFHGALVEVLTRTGGDCDACLPVVPGDPAVRACAARYLIDGT
jgi:hypothetical protein